MDYLTAYRTFGNSKYSPAKGKLRLYDDRWYFVTFQNTSRDQGDGYYLEEGEYTQLLPGKEAREARDAHLNHCNAISEHHGSVYAVYIAGSEWRWPFTREYAATMAEAQTMADNKTARLHQECQEAITAIDRELSKTDAELIANYGNCKDWPGNEQREMEKWRAFYRKNRMDAEKRLAIVATIETVREANKPISAPVAPDTVTVTHERDWTWVTFPSIPSEEVRTAIKALGARFSNKRLAWYFTQHIEEAAILVAIEGV